MPITLCPASGAYTTTYSPSPSYAPACSLLLYGAVTFSDSATVGVPNTTGGTHPSASMMLP